MKRQPGSARTTPRRTAVLASDVGDGRPTATHPATEQVGDYHHGHADDGTDGHEGLTAIVDGAAKSVLEALEGLAKVLFRGGGLSLGAVVGVTVVVVAYLLGRRVGRRRTTFVEIRRV
jgi:hypothetical protein